MTPRPERCSILPLAALALLPVAGTGWLLSPPSILSKPASAAGQLSVNFIDITKQSGINFTHYTGAFGKKYLPETMGSGCAFIDYDNDGNPDILLIQANDFPDHRSGQRRTLKLYHNNGNGTFTEQAVQAGIAFSEDGVARGAMGIDAADFDGSGYPSLAIGNFSNQMIGLYHNERNRFFIDIAPSSSVGRASLLSLSFGLFFCDYDLDGLDDLFVANGHIEPDINRIQPQVSYAELPLVFHNEGRDAKGNERFLEVGKQVGFSKPLVARGAAYADIDNDGAPDILLTTNGGPAYLFHNVGGSGNNTIRIRTVGTRSNRDGIGAVVSVHTPGELGVRSEQTVHSGSSYCSQSELTLTFGLGKASVADIEIEWPSGQKDNIGGLAANSTYTLEEGGKVLGKRPFKR